MYLNCVELVKKWCTELRSQNIIRLEEGSFTSLVCIFHVIYSFLLYRSRYRRLPTILFYSAVLLLAIDDSFCLEQLETGICDFMDVLSVRSLSSDNVSSEYEVVNPSTENEHQTVGVSCEETGLKVVI